MNTLCTTLAAVLFAGTAMAGEIQLTSPMQAASLHEPGVDMVVYYLDIGSAYEVVATYIETDHPAEPLRLRMALNDGDAVTFALPGFRGTSYRFARSGADVTVISKTEVDLALNDN